MKSLNSFFHVILKSADWIKKNIIRIMYSSTRQTLELNRQKQMKKFKLTDYRLVVNIFIICLGFFLSWNLLYSGYRDRSMLDPDWWDECVRFFFISIVYRLWITLFLRFQSLKKIYLVRSKNFRSFSIYFFRFLTELSFTKIVFLSFVQIFFNFSERSILLIHCSFFSERPPFITKNVVCSKKICPSLVRSV